MDKWLKLSKSKEYTSCFGTDISHADLTESNLTLIIQLHEQKIHTNVCENLLPSPVGPDSINAPFGYEQSCNNGNSIDFQIGNNDNLYGVDEFKLVQINTFGHGGWS